MNISDGDREIFFYQSLLFPQYIIFMYDFLCDILQREGINKCSFQEGSYDN
jgi:hypothetical protein